MYIQLYKVAQIISFPKQVRPKVDAGIYVYIYVRVCMHTYMYI